MKVHVQQQQAVLLTLVVWVFLISNCFVGVVEALVTNRRAHDTVCKKEYDCSTGCIAIVGNGAISRGQAEMALRCGDVYRANQMNNAGTCANRATHCFYRATKRLFHGVNRNGFPTNPHVACPHSVFVDADPVSKGMRWTNPGRTYETVKLNEYRQDPEDPVKRVWSNLKENFTKNNQTITNLRRRRLGKNPLDMKSSTGLIMMDYALRHQNGRCIHIFGFNFQKASEASSHLGRHHPFGSEMKIVSELLLSSLENGGVFFHATPYEAVHTGTTSGSEPAFGLASMVEEMQHDTL